MEAEENEHATRPMRKGTTMARFHFHFSSKDGFFQDPNGRELEDIGAAHRHALLLIEKAVLLLSHELDWTGWSIDVSDQTGRTLLCVLFPQNLKRYTSVPQLSPPSGP